MRAEHYPAEWREKIPGRVFACLRRGEIQIVLCPGMGLANGGRPIDVPIERVPFELRTPNTNVWVRVNEKWEVEEVWQRAGDETVGK